VRYVKLGETAASYFDVRLLDGTPALAEEGGQPEYNINGGSFNPVGIGALVAIQYGRYSAQLESVAIVAVGDVVCTRYKSALTQETAGDTFLVIDPDGTLPTDAPAFSFYGSVAGGDTFFNSSLRGRVWKRSSPANKRLALIDATRLIDRLNFAGSKASDLQVLQFPRKNTHEDDQGGDDTYTQDDNVPDAVKQAVYLVADKLLDGWDPDMEADALATGNARYSGASLSYDREYIPEHQRAGMPSREAWDLLRPFVRDPLEIDLRRA
jgi:hypothetical protein